MIVLIVAAALIAAYAAVSVYFRKAAQYLEASDVVYSRLFESAKKALSDDEMPDEAAAFAGASAVCAGCGCLSRAILLNAFHRVKPGKAPDHIHRMSNEQRDTMYAVTVNAIYYDTLRAPISGFLVRRFVYPWLKDASEGVMHARQREVSRIAKVTSQTIAHRPEGRKLLQTA